MAYIEFDRVSKEYVMGEVKIKALNKATNTKRPFAKAYKSIMDIRNSEGFETINTIIEENTRYSKLHKFNELETIEETLKTLNDLVELDSYSEQKENI